MILALARKGEERFNGTVPIDINDNGGDGEVNDISDVTTDNGQRTTDSWYTLNGVKLDDEPTEAGVYICNGKKVVIK